MRSIETVVGGLSSRTRVVVIDHVTSPTGLVLPIEELVAELENRGVDHDRRRRARARHARSGSRGIGAAFYTGNCHKWLCAPKGAAFLQVRDDWRDRTHPLVTSHGAGAPLIDRSRFRLEFDWTGTGDPTPWLTVPTAIETLSTMVPGGWPEIRSRNQKLALAALDHLCSSTGIQTPCPDKMIGSMAAVPLPSRPWGRALPMGGMDPLQERLFGDFSIEIPITLWADPCRRAVRISAHLYNTIEEFRYLATGLAASALD